MKNFGVYKNEFHAFRGNFDRSNEQNCPKATPRAISGEVWRLNLFSMSKNRFLNLTLKFESIIYQNCIFADKLKKNRFLIAYFKLSQDFMLKTQEVKSSAAAATRRFFKFSIRKNSPAAQIKFHEFHVEIWFYSYEFLNYILLYFSTIVYVNKLG